MKKGLTIVSVLMLILGAVTLLTGIMSITLLGAASDGSTEAKAVIDLAFILLVLGGLLDVIGGVLGLRAAGSSAKAGGAVIFGFLALAAGIASAVLELNVQNICACVIPLIYFVCAAAVKASR